MLVDDSLILNHEALDSIEKSDESGEDRSDQPRVLTIGSALVDIFITSDQFEIAHGDEEVFTTRSRGGKLSVDSFKIKTGGGAGNTAAGFAKLGFSVGCVAELGNDELAQMVVADLERFGVSTQYLIHERREETGGSVLLVTPEGDRVALVHRGAAAELDPHDIDELLIMDQDWVHLSSLADQVETAQTVFEAAKKYQVKLSWNPGKAELEALVAGRFELNNLAVEIMFLNQEEWQLVEPLWQQLESAIKTIVVTDGARGGKIISAGETSDFEALKVKAVDTTGAGDSFAVGFVGAILLGHDSLTAADWGRRNSASVVQQAGAKQGLLPRDHF